MAEVCAAIVEFLNRVYRRLQCLDWTEVELMKLQRHINISKRMNRAVCGPYQASFMETSNLPPESPCGRIKTVENIECLSADFFERLHRRENCIESWNIQLKNKLKKYSGMNVLEEV